MFREMRRSKQQMSEDAANAILKSATSGVLSLLGDDGYPYGVPISYVYEEGKLYFHSALSGHKVDAVRNYDKASFTVIVQDDIVPEKYTTLYRSVIAFGCVHIPMMRLSAYMEYSFWQKNIIRENQKPGGAKKWLIAQTF